LQPFKDISIFSYRGHLGWMSELSDKILKGDHQRTILAYYGLNWLSSFQRRFSNEFFSKSA